MTALSQNQLIMNTTTQLLVALTGVLILTVLCRVVWNALVTTVVVPLHTRAIHSRYGKLIGILDPGRYRFLGAGHEIKLFDNRIQQITLQTQEVTTLEGISIKATAVGLYRIVDPLLTESATADFNGTLYTMIQLALRDVIGGIEAEAILTNARHLGPKLLDIVREKANGLGVELTELVIRDVILPADIKAALSESWRSKKSAIAELESARGKVAAARTLANAAKLYEASPSLLKIRYIEALEQASKGMGNTFVIGMPDEKSFKLI
jgi:regulator of protease activity HflC (stomatin/prohibitin superfamily)